MKKISVLTVALLVLAGGTAIATPNLTLNVATGSAANGWNTTPVDLSAANVLDWYVGNNTNWGQTDPETWDWNHTYTAPGNEKLGASILSNFYLGYAGGDPSNGYTGGHTNDSSQVHFSYTDGVSPASEADRIGTNWMTDNSGANGIMRLSVDASANGGSLRVTQWFNYSDAWEETTWGHTLTAKLFDSSDVLIGSQSWTDPISGPRGGTNIGFTSDYTATIDITGAGAGSYLIFEHLTSNIGYRGTMVTIPAPGAVVLGMIGFGLVGWVKRRFA